MQRLVHVLQGESYIPSVQPRKDRALSFCREDLAFSGSMSSPQNHLITSELVTNADPDFWAPLGFAELICGIGDRESKFFINTLGVSHTHSSLRTTDHQD